MNESQDIKDEKNSISEHGKHKTPFSGYLFIGVVLVGIIYSWRHWLPTAGYIIFSIVMSIWYFITPASYTLFLYKDSAAVRGTDVPDQRIDGYGSLHSCQEKGVEFTQKGYAQFSCGERCKNPAAGEIDCVRAYY